MLLKLAWRQSWEAQFGRESCNQAICGKAIGMVAAACLRMLPGLCAVKASDVRLKYWMLCLAHLFCLQRAAAARPYAAGAALPTQRWTQMTLTKMT